jgi:hypothetical protein
VEKADASAVKVAEMRILAKTAALKTQRISGQPKLS